MAGRDADWGVALSLFSGFTGGFKEIATDLGDFAVLGK